MVFRNLMRRKLRTLFAVSGVALGIAAMVALTAITQGMLQQFVELTEDYRGDVIVQQAKVPDPVFSQIPEDMTRKLAALPEVREVCPLGFTGKKIPGDLFFAIAGMPENSTLLELHTLLPGESRYFRPGAAELILGKDAAEHLGKKVGDPFVIGEHEFTVVGIFQINISVMDRACIMSLQNFFAVATTDKVNMMVVYLHDPSTQVLPFIQKVAEQFPGYEGIESSSFLSNFEQVDLIEALALMISVIAISIAGIGILNTMMMSVYERTREIGLLRAVGWPSRKVLVMILAEGVLVSLGGGVLGILIGIVGAEFLVRSIQVGMVTSYYPPSLFVHAMLFSLAVGLLGALLPAWKASRFSPIEALRYE